MRYAVVGVVQELYFVEADDPDAAKEKVATGALSGEVRPAAWETISLVAYDEEAQARGPVMPRRHSI